MPENKTDLRLKKETEKWLSRIEPLLEKINPADSRTADLLKNMHAYISDSKHFLEKRDFILAFECVVWVWSIYELGKELKIFDIK